MLFSALIIATLSSFFSLLPSITRWFSGPCCPGILTDLGPQLSSHGQIYLPGSDQFIQATTRWSAFKAPHFTAVVEVATESDVEETVKYANKHNIPFIPVNGGHGSISSLANFKNGIQIWLHKLNSISIADDGRTAIIGGGALAKHITETLWEKGKQTVTGLCECTSLLGPGLGGGHGILQGHYGLVADQFVSLRMVLANGTLLTVDQNSDLWWAVKGAGHNFGIVTSITSKVHDIPSNDSWSYIRFVYTHDKVEALYEAINTHFLKNGIQPVDLNIYSLFFNAPMIDPDHALILFFILQEGTASVEYGYAHPFRDIGPLFTESGSGSFKDITAWTGMTTSHPACQKNGLSHTRFAVNLHQYNPMAQRTAFDHFSHITHSNTALNQSVFLFEGYSVQGVRSVPSDSSAVPNREANILVASDAIHEPGDKRMETEAYQFGKALRDIVFRGSDQQDLHSYVNYAAGDEGPQSWYGYEPWRLQKLRGLKAKYDPNHRFRFYAPVI